jgi:predicted DNA-binding transcriptional regulator YafY
MKTRPAIERLVALIVAASRTRGTTTKEMAYKMNVSTKTIHRDWDFLRDRLLVDLEIKQFRYVARDPKGVVPLIKTLAALR